MFEGVTVCVFLDLLRLLQVRVHVGFVSAVACWPLLVLLLRHDLQRHLHLPLQQRQWAFQVRFHRED